LEIGEWIFLSCFMVFFGLLAFEAFASEWKDSYFDGSEAV